jgi:hypothetical protein
MYRGAVALQLLENAIVPEAGQTDKLLFLEHQRRRPAFAFSLGLAGKLTNM